MILVTAAGSAMVSVSAPFAVSVPVVAVAVLVLVSPVFVLIAVPSIFTITLTVVAVVAVSVAIFIPTGSAVMVVITSPASVSVPVPMVPVAFLVGIAFPVTAMPAGPSSLVNGRHGAGTDHFSASFRLPIGAFPPALASTAMLAPRRSAIGNFSLFLCVIGACCCRIFRVCAFVPTT